MIIATSAHRYFSVSETECPDLAHCWDGIEVRRDRRTGQWVKKAGTSDRPVLVRKAATRVVEA